MTLQDYRGDDITGAGPAALQAYENALAAFQSWRTGAPPHVEQALEQAPGFTMAHVLGAYLGLTSRDPRRVRGARQFHASALELPANEREAMHIAAIGATLDDDYDRAKSILGELLEAHPRDVLALQVVHAYDYATGDTESLESRIRSVLPAWSDRMPGYAAVLAMRAFALTEGGDYGQAAESAMRALALNPFDARAHHALAHVYEMTENAPAGIRRMRHSQPLWGDGTLVSTHCWWHLAVFHLAEDDPATALHIYDERIRAGRSQEMGDLIDASSLLWRLELLGTDLGTRWAELAMAWGPHIADRFCSFNDIHAMLAFAGARDWMRARWLERELEKSAATSTRHGETTRAIGLPACRALHEFGLGNHAAAAEILGRLPQHLRTIGGSHAQRDVLYLTWMRAVECLRRRPHRVAA